jgi:uncharacterized protein YegJ (DUF2314 family)
VPEERGAVAVHVIWERLIFNPYLYRGAIQVSNDDPVMQEALEKARQTVPLFLGKVFPEHRQDSMVKFRFKTSSGEVEYLWADLLEVNGDKLRVYVRTPPLHHDQPMDQSHEICLDEVMDWQVECRDGAIRGGYTNRALFTIFEREQGYLHPKLRMQQARFRDVEEATEA